VNPCDCRTFALLKSCLTVKLSERQANNFSAMLGDSEMAAGAFGLFPQPTSAKRIHDSNGSRQAPQATPKQAIDQQAAILAALRKRNGGAVLSDGAPAHW